MKTKSLTEAAHKANLFLQILLFLNVYLSLMWTLVYGFHICNNFSDLWDFRGKFVILGYIIAASVEAGRLYAGYSGNLKADTGDLSIFLILSSLMQSPSLLFLVPSARRYAFVTTLTYVLIGFILMEFIIGIHVWRKHSYHQAKLYQLKMQDSLNRIKSR